MCKENSLANRFPHLLAEWDYEKNGDLTPEEVTYASHRKISWICTIKNHKYDMSPAKRTSRNSGCPYCANQMVCEDNCLATRYPELAIEWHPTKNGELTPFNTLPGRHAVIWWICPDKGHEYDMSPNRRVSNGQNCPFCANKRACEDNCLATIRPDLAKEWHPTKNGELTPFNTLPARNKKAWWICPDKGHEYDMSPAERTQMKANCPYCANKRVCEDNCLATIRPDLAKEWHPTKNGELTPFNIFQGSVKKIWWICPDKGHEYDMSPNHRSSRNQNCPYCANKRVCEDNCLATIRPDLAKEWHPTKNGRITPHNIVAGSYAKVWWLCSEGHIFFTRPSQRLASNSGCPTCNQSKGELRIGRFLSVNFVNYQPHQPFDDCRHINPLPFDFFVNYPDDALAMVIEYQGIQHYQVVEHFGGKEGFEDRKRNDKIKRDYCKTNKIPFLEIKYTEFDRIEEILTKKLSKLGLLKIDKDKLVA